MVYDILENEVSFSGKEVEIRSYLDGKILCFVDDTKISLKRVEEK